MFAPTINSLVRYYHTFKFSHLDAAIVFFSFFQNMNF
uniref:Uncharacterized protein n=1 Tax=Anguilla anguilla TaxID=7936 RepID=A0A0E9V201_ANGAN